MNTKAMTNGQGEQKSVDAVRDGRHLMQNDGMEKPELPPFPLSPEDGRIQDEMLTLLVRALAPEHPNYRFGDGA
jgi:hypothetical protein